jgi:K+-transporting ATPase KdpF subunit
VLVAWSPVFNGAFAVNITYVLATVIAVLLAGYLCVALLKPEWFE